MATISLVVGIVALGATSAAFVLGKPVEPTSQVEKVRGAGATAVTTPAKPSLNITVKELRIESEDNETFRSGQTIKVHCLIANTSEEKTSNFGVVIRTPGGEIAHKEISLKGGEETELEGTFTATAQGRVILACRADPDKKLIESSKGDNKKVIDLYFFEAPNK